MEKQERNVTLKEILAKLALSIEGGSTFSEALAQHPKVFNRLFVNMVKAGELGGVLEVVLNRLAEFMEKAQKIKGKVVAAMFYPVAVMVVAAGILIILMVFVVQLLIYGFHELTEANIFPYSEPLHWATEPYGPDGRYGRYLTYLLVMLPLGWLLVSSLVPRRTIRQSAKV